MGAAILLYRVVVKECLICKLIFKQGPKKVIRAFCGVFQAQGAACTKALGRNMLDVPKEQQIT